MELKVNQVYLNRSGQPHRIITQVGEEFQDDKGLWYGKDGKFFRTAESSADLVAPYAPVIWTECAVQLPPVGLMVLLYSDKWRDEDYNPEGVVEGFIDDESMWTVTGWDNVQDCFDTTEHETLYPSHWTFKPKFYDS